MNNEKWLSVDEIEHLTGVKRPADQKRVLTQNNISFTIRSDGKPVVCWYNVYHKDVAANSVDDQINWDAA